jgi:hypothetical protein
VAQSTSLYSSQNPRPCWILGTLSHLFALPSFPLLLKGISLSPSGIIAFGKFRPLKTKARMECGRMAFRQLLLWQWLRDLEGLANLRDKLLGVSSKLVLR